MAGRNDATIVVALEPVAQAVRQQPNANVGANDEVRMLETFLRNHPPTSKGDMILMGPRRGSRRSRECLELCSARRCRRCVLVRTC